MLDLMLSIRMTAHGAFEGWRAGLRFGRGYLASAFYTACVSLKFFFEREFLFLGLELNLWYIMCKILSSLSNDHIRFFHYAG